MTRILCFGDSITYAGQDTAGGWSKRLSNYLGGIYVDEQGNNKLSVYNLGISADTSTDLVKRFDAELEARASKDSVVIFMIGTNDSAYFQNGDAWVSIEDYEKNLDILISKAKNFVDKVMVVGLTPCIDSMVQPIPLDKNVSYSNQRIGLYNEKVQEMAKKHEIEFEDIFNDFRKLELDIYMDDGLHPNAVGQQYICDRIKKKVAQMSNDYEGKET